MIGTTDTDRSGETFTRVAVKLGSGKVHYARKYDGWGVSPQCGGNRASERYRVVNQDVDCKRCLKLLAAEEAAERAHQDRVDASMQPATGEGDYLAPAAETTEVEQPEAAQPEAAQPELDKVTGWLIVTDRDGTRYAVGGRVQGPFGGMDYVLYRRMDTVGSQRRAYPDAMRGTLQRYLWDARARYDLDRQAVREAQRSGRMQVTNPPLTAEPKSAPARDAEAEQLDTAREALLRQLAGIDARLAELRPEPSTATEVRIVMDSDSVGSAWVNGTEYAVFRGLSSWGVMGTGIRGNSLDGIGKALARRLGVEGPVTTTVARPLD